MALKQTIRSIAAIVVGAAMLAGCGKPSGLMPQPSAARVQSFKTASVPQNFLWGVSTAGFQWEGNDSNSNWALWGAAGKTEDPYTEMAQGYSRFGEDAFLAKGLGCNAFRTSLEWSRLEPREGYYDPAAIAHYHEQLNAFKARGLTPIITLMHFSYPAWLDVDGGWENPKTAERFARFAAFVAKEFGSDIDYYLTINEPNAFLAGAYVSGMFPPGKKGVLGLIAGLKAMKNLKRGHALAYDAVHANDPQAKVSLNMYVAEYGFGKRPSAKPEEKSALDLVSDTTFLDGLAPSAPSGEVAAKSIAGRKMDYVSFDYYCRMPLTLPFVFPRPDTWEICPEGFYRALKRYHQRYKLPILIAENGIATNNGQPRQDGWTRAAFLAAHVKQMQRAMAEGVSVLGYVHWSITDNYELGSFAPRFGLYQVECMAKDYRRIPTDGVDAYRQIIASNGVNDTIASRYAAPAGRSPLAEQPAE